jgi:uncharacterized membrane protein YfcA
VPDPTTALYYAVVLFVAYLVRGVAGFGSGLIAVPLLSLVAPVPAVVPLVVALDYIGSLSQGIKNLDRIAWTEQLVLVPFMIAGILGGLYLLSALPTTVLAHSLGAFVIVFAVYQWLPLPRMHASRSLASLCGILGGLVGTLFGTGGPFYVIYLNLRTLEKTVFRATFAINFLIDGGIRLAAYVVMGLIGWKMLLTLGATLPVAAAGLYLGGRVQTGFSQTTFVRFVSALLVASGITLLLKR